MNPPTPGVPLLLPLAQVLIPLRFFLLFGVQQSARTAGQCVVAQEVCFGCDELCTTHHGNCTRSVDPVCTTDCQNRVYDCEEYNKGLSCVEQELRSVVATHGDFVTKARFGLTPGFREWDEFGQRDQQITEADVEALCDTFDGGSMSTRQCGSIEDEAGCELIDGCSYDQTSGKCRGCLSGEGSTDERATPMQTAKCPLVRRAFHEMDTSGDGRVDEQEFDAGQGIAKSVSDGLQAAPPDGGPFAAFAAALLEHRHGQNAAATALRPRRPPKGTKPAAAATPRLRLRRDGGRASSGRTAPAQQRP